MSIPNAPLELQTLNLSAIDPDPQHVRTKQTEGALNGLINAIQQVGLIQPILVRPGELPGRYVVVAGERRRQAALAAGAETIPALIRTCTKEDRLAIQIFENLGQGVRSALEPRDMAQAIQRLSERFESADDAARYFGRAPTWVNQATAAARLSEPVVALLDAGKISSASTAIQLEKLVQKDEASAQALIKQIEQLPEGEKLSKKALDRATGKTRGPATAPQEDLGQAATTLTAPATPQAMASTAPSPSAPEAVGAQAEPSTTAPAAPTSTPTSATPRRTEAAPDLAKRQQVAALLGIEEDDEATLMARLIDEFLALKGIAQAE